MGGGRKRLWQAASKAVEERLPARIGRSLRARNLQRNRQVGLARNANLAAHQPIDMGTELGSGRCFERGVGAQGYGEKHFILVPKIHKRAERQPAGRRKLHGAGGDAGWEHPFNARWLAGVTCIDPIDVPALVQGEVQADLCLASGLNGALERQQLNREVLRPHWSLRPEWEYWGPRLRQWSNLRRESAARSAGTKRVGED